MLRIPLNGKYARGRFFTCDEQDSGIARSHSWSLTGPNRNYVVAAGCRKTFHILVLGSPPKGFEWDHEDRDTLNNCRSNLRLVTNSTNKHNTRLWANNTSGYKGVNFLPRLGKWRAYISVDKKLKHLGVFRNKEDAIEARQLAELLYFPLVYSAQSTRSNTLSSPPD